MYKTLNQVYSESVNKIKVALPWENVSESINPQATRVILYAEDPDTKERSNLGEMNPEFYHKELLPFIKRGHPESIGLVRTIQTRLANLHAGSKDNIDEYYHFCKDVGIDLNKTNADKFAEIIWKLTNENTHSHMSKILELAYNTPEELILSSKHFMSVLLAMPVNKGESGDAAGKGEVFLAFFSDGSKPLGTKESKGDVMIGETIYEVKKASPNSETSGANLLDHAATTYTTETFKRDIDKVYKNYLDGVDKTQNKIQAVNELTTIVLNCAGGAQGVNSNEINKLHNEVKSIININLETYFKETNAVPTVRLSKSLERLIGCINLKAYCNLKQFHGIIVFTDLPSGKTPISFLLTQGKSVSDLIINTEKSGITFRSNLHKRGLGGLAVFICMSNSIK